MLAQIPSTRASRSSTPKRSIPRAFAVCSQCTSAGHEAMEELASALGPRARVELQAGLRDRQNLRRVGALQDLESQRNEVLGQHRDTALHAVAQDIFL